MRFEAMRIIQPSGRAVFSFATTATDLLKVAEIPRLGRDGEGQLVGYQRPEVISHILEIRRYLESNDAVLPNTIVVAFNSSASFTAVSTSLIGDVGYLDVPDTEKGEVRTGFVVDGQQRLAAIAGCQSPGFPFFATAMITSDMKEQRKQFVLVNRTKPLPQGMIFELLPEIDGSLPQYLVKQRIAAGIVSDLNQNGDSALYRRIKTPTCPVGLIKDNSIRRTILNSLNDGALFHVAQAHPDPHAQRVAMVRTVSVFWSATAAVFPAAWSLPPKQSRLSHGVGVVSLGYVMDQVWNQCRGKEWTVEAVVGYLEMLKSHCAWTSGHWRFGPGEERNWNELQNTDRDVRILTNYFRKLLSTPPTR